MSDLDSRLLAIADDYVADKPTTPGDLDSRLLAIADDYVADKPTTPGVYLKIVWSSISPMNWVWLICLALGWAWIVYNSWVTQSLIVKNDEELYGNGTPQFTSVEEIEKFGTEQTFDGRETNATEGYDLRDGKVITDDRKSTMSCYLFGVNCPVGQPGRGVGKKFKVRYNGPFDMTYVEQSGTRKLSMRLSDLMKQNMCSDVSREDAGKFFCERGLTEGLRVKHSLVNSDVCTSEVDPSNCGVWRECALNMVLKHFSKEGSSWFGGTALNLNDEGTLKLDTKTDWASFC